VSLCVSVCLCLCVRAHLRVAATMTDDVRGTIAFHAALKKIEDRAAGNYALVEALGLLTNAFKDVESKKPGITHAFVESCKGRASSSSNQSAASLTSDMKHLQVQTGTGKFKVTKDLIVHADYLVEVLKKVSEGRGADRKKLMGAVKQSADAIKLMLEKMEQQQPEDKEGEDFFAGQRRQFVSSSKLFTNGLKDYFKYSDFKVVERNVNAIQYDVAQFLSQCGVEE